MNKIQEITKGKAKSMFTTENDDHLIFFFIHIYITRHRTILQETHHRII